MKDFDTNTQQMRLLLLARSELASIKSDMQNVKTCFSSDDADRSYVCCKVDNAVESIEFALYHVCKMIDDKKEESTNGKNN